MIKFVLPALAALILVAPAHARSGIVQYGGETVEKYADLPDKPQLRAGAAFVDIGLIYKTVSILYVPVWSYEARWVGYIGSSSDYLGLEADALIEMAHDHGITLPEEPPVPMTPRLTGLGGGALAAFALALVAMSRRRRSADAADPAQPSRLEALARGDAPLPITPAPAMAAPSPEVVRAQPAAPLPAYAPPPRPLGQPAVFGRRAAPPAGQGKRL